MISFSMSKYPTDMIVRKGTRLRITADQLESIIVVLDVARIPISVAVQLPDKLISLRKLGTF